MRVEAIYKRAKMREVEEVTSLVEAHQVVEIVTSAVEAHQACPIVMMSPQGLNGSPYLPDNFNQSFWLLKTWYEQIWWSIGSIGVSTEARVYKYKYKISWVGQSTMSTEAWVLDRGEGEDEVKLRKNASLPKVSSKNLPKVSYKRLPKVSSKNLPKASSKNLPKVS